MLYNKIKLFAVFFCISVSASAQLYIAPGEIFYMPAGVTHSFDSLVLTPSSALTLSGVTISKSYTAVSGSGGNSINRVYNFSGAISFTGNAGIFINNSELNGNALADLQIAYDPGSGFINTNTSNVNQGNNFVSNQFASLVSFTKITAVASGIVLPVQLLAFDALLLDKKVKLTWTTASEKQIENFIIEKSYDGNLYTKLLTEKPRGGNTQTHYTVYDDNPKPGLNYYRLASVGMQGEKSYSSAKAIRYSTNEKTEFSIFPNPARSTVNAQFSGSILPEASLIITDMNGKIYMQIPVTQNKISFNVDQLSAGIYFIKYSDKINNSVQKLIKL